MPARAENGLPEKAFVFCSFNNNYKFTPELFAVWMRILKRVPDSVFWLLADNEWAKDNLIKTANKLGIKKERLIFASRVSPANYLARYQLADLFLDTFPFNGGTTANDALFMGLPLLTLSGRTFASRMAGSLLTHLGLPELIANNLKEYEEKAVRLAKNTEKLKTLKTRLRESKKSGPVFDSPRFVKDYENALVKAAAITNPETESKKLSNEITQFSQLISGGNQVESKPANQAPMKQTPAHNIPNNDLLALIPSECRRIVEIGCMQGALAKHYRADHPKAEYIGVDIDPDYAKIAEQYCTRAFGGDVEQLPPDVFASLFPSDCWIFGDCLEHLRDPWTLLRRIRNGIDSDGCLLACIPNAQHWSVQLRLATGRFLYEDSGLLDRTHIRWFTRITMINMFQTSGWSIERAISRNISAPQQEQALRAISAMAEIGGFDPELAVQDATPFQYIFKVVPA